MRFRRNIHNASKLDIVVPIYNGAKYLDQALNSIDKLATKPNKVILIDNFSSDNTFDILTDWSRGKLNVEIFQNNKQLSFPENWNYGLSLAKSDYVHFLAHDDVLKSNFISNFDIILRKYPNLDAISMRVQRFSDHNIHVKRKTSIPFDRELNSEEYLIKSLVRNPFNLAGGIYRRNKLIEIGFMSEKYYLWSDWVLWRRLLTEGSVIRSWRVSSKYRLHSDFEKKSERLQYVDHDLGLFIKDEVIPTVKSHNLTTNEVERIIAKLTSQVWADARL